jgi:Leucine-rich repeat (LRR) protein
MLNTKNININDLLVFKKLIELIYKSNNIQFMANLESLVDLQILNLANNNITVNKNRKNRKFYILKNYNKLKYVYINNNLIKDITTLKNNKFIKYLNISNNNIDNIDIINNFEDLEILNILNNPILVIPDLLKFKKLDFDNLQVNWNNVKDMQGMKGYKLIKNIIKSLINKN